jgi:hypothetical protein
MKLNLKDIPVENLMQIKKNIRQGKDLCLGSYS